MLLGSGIGQWLKPMREMSGTPLNCPHLDRVRNGIRSSLVEEGGTRGLGLETSKDGLGECLLELLQSINIDTK